MKKVLRDRIRTDMYTQMKRLSVLETIPETDKFDPYNYFDITSPKNNYSNQSGGLRVCSYNYMDLGSDEESDEESDDESDEESDAGSDEDEYLDEDGDEDEYNSSFEINDSDEYDGYMPFSRKAAMLDEDIRYLRRIQSMETIYKAEGEFNIFTKIFESILD